MKQFTESRHYPDLGSRIRVWCSKLLSLAMVLQLVLGVWPGPLQGSKVQARAKTEPSFAKNAEVLTVPGADSRANVSFTKTAEPIPGKVNTWKIKLRAEFMKSEIEEIKSVPQDVHLIVDASGSMRDRVGMRPKAWYAITAAKEFAANVLSTNTATEYNRIAYYKYSTEAPDAIFGLTNESRYINHMTIMPVGGATYTAGALQKAYEAAKRAYAATGRAQTIVLLSDGMPTLGFPIKDHNIRPEWLEASNKSFVYDKDPSNINVNGSEIFDTPSMVTSTKVPYDQLVLNSRYGSGAPPCRVSVKNYPDTPAGQKPIVYDWGNLLQVQANHIKADPAVANLITISYAMSDGPEGTEILRGVADKGQAYVAGAYDIKTTFDKIYKTLVKRDTDISVTDPMGPGFSLPNQKSIKALTGSTSYNSKNETLTWTIGNSLLLDKQSGRYYTELSYEVEIDDGILTAAADPDDTTAFPTNGTTTIRYKTPDGDYEKRNAKVPKVHPTLLKVEKVLLDENGKKINNSDEEFTLNVKGPQGFAKQFKLKGNTASTSTALRLAGAYTIEEVKPQARQGYEYITQYEYYMNGSKVDNPYVDNGIDDERYALTNELKLKVINQEVSKTGFDLLKNTVKITDAKGRVYEDNMFHAVGDKIYYSFTLTNKGRTNISKITFRDPLLGEGFGPSVSVNLAPGEKYTYVVPEANAYVVTQQNLDEGRVLNTVYAKVTRPGGETPEKPAERTDKGQPNPKFTVQKSATRITDALGNPREDNKFHAVGDKIYYSFKINNVGKVTLHNIVLDDKKLNLHYEGDINTAAGSHYVYAPETPYVVTEADLQAKQVHNVVTVETPDFPYLPPEKDEHDVPAAFEPGFTVVKNVVKVTKSDGKTIRKDGTYQAVGDKIFYSFTISNTGNMTLKKAVIKDALLAVNETVEMNLLPGKDYVYEVAAPYVIKQSDLDAGKVLNVVTVTIPDTELPPGQSEKVVPGSQKPGFKVVKNAVKVTEADGKKERPDGMFLEAGDKIFYSFTLTNTGNVVLKKARLQDEKLGLDTTVEINLAPGAEYTYEAAEPYVVTQADMNAGKVHNVVNVTIPDTDIPPEEGEHDVPGTKTPDFTVQKNAVKVTEADGETLRKDGKFHAEGDKIFYSFTVKNTGNVTITKVKFVDELLNVDLTLDQTILPGDSYTYEVPTPYTVTQDDINAGQVLNTVTVTPTTPDGELPPKDGGHKVPGEKSPGFKVVKNAVKVTAGDGKKERPDGMFLEAGDKIFYSFTLTNTGNVTLKKARLQDEKLGLDTTVEINLAPGAEYTYEAAEPYVVTQADMNAGKVHNVVNVTIPDTDIPPEEGEHDVPGTKTPDFTVQKNAVKVTEADGKTVREDGKFHAADDKIFYSFTVNNTGNVTITKVKFVDELLSVDVTLDQTILPGDSYTYNVPEPYIVTQNDMDAAQVLNTVTVTPTTPDGELPPKDGGHKVPGEKTPQFTVAKNALKVTEADGEIVRKDGKFHAAGDKIFYSFTVNNTGNVTITKVKFVDELLGVDVTLDETILPGGSYTYTVPTPYTVTQDDVNAGQVLNTVTVTPTTPDGDLPPKDGGHKVPGEKTPQFTVAKNAVKVTEADGETVREDGKFHAEGDKIFYSFTVKNTGNVTITKVKFVDELLGVDVTLDETILPGGSYTYTVPTPYTVTQDDVNAGQVLNTVTVTPTTPDGDLPPKDGGHKVPGEKTPQFTVAKNAVKVTEADGETVREDGKFHAAGDKIYYSFTVNNTGNVTITKVKFVDELLGVDVTLDETILPGESYTYEVPEAYSVTQDDVNAGQVLNTVTVTPTTPDGELPPKDGGHKVPGEKNPGFKVVKNAVKVTEADGKKERPAGMFLEAGDKIFYSFTLTNTGNVTLKKARLQDEKLGLDATVEINLAPGAEYTYDGAAPYTVTQADMDAGKVHNVVNVTIPDTDIPPEDGEHDVPGEKTPQFTVAKNAVKVTEADAETVRKDGKFHAAGDKIYYSFTVKNTGNVTITKVKFVDELLGVDVALEQTILPGESYTYEVPEAYSVTQDDVDAGEVLNTVTVTPTTPDGELPPKDGGHKVPGEKTPQFTVAKNALKVTEADGETVRKDGKFHAAGDKIYYSFTVNNTGNVTITKVKFVDELLGVDVTLDETILPGDSYTYEVPTPYSVTQDDVDAGEVLNTVTVTPTTPDGDLPPKDGGRKVPGEKNPGFTVVKNAVKVTAADGEKERPDGMFLEAGDKIFYSFTLTNTGNVTLKKARLQDEKLGLDATVEINLAPGAEYTYDGAAPYTVTQADMDAGKVHNVVNVTIPDTDIPPEDGEHDVPGTKTPDFTVQKNVVKVTEADGKTVREDGKFHAAGDKIYYSFTVNNTGNVTITKVKFVDPLLQVLISVDETILPGASYTYEVPEAYSVTQADVDAGEVLNTVTVTPTTPDGELPPKDGGSKVPGEKNPGFTVVKNAVKVTAADGEKERPDGMFLEAGDKIFYSFTLTNTGNVTLKNARLQDEKLGLDVTLEINLAPASEYTYEASEPYIVTQADMDAGKVHNVVNVTIPDTDIPPEDGEHDVPGTKTPDFKVQKNVVKVTEADGKTVREDGKFHAAGDKIFYSFTVKNTGNVTITKVKFVDPLLQVLISVDETILPGASYTYEVPEAYSVTQADVDAGEVLNTVTVTPTTPDGELPPKDGGSKVPGEKNPGFKVVKDAVKVTQADGETVRPDGMFREAGDKIYYSFTLTNTGNVTLKNARLQDEKLGLDVTVEVNLAPSAEFVYQPGEPYTVTQADMDAGKVHNVVNVTIPDTDIPPEDGDHDVPGEKTPDFTVQKNVVKVTEADGKTVREDGKFHAAGDKIYYSFTVKNSGNVTINKVKFVDPLLQVLISVDETILPGASYTYEVPEAYSVTQADVDAGEVLNTVTVTPTTPDGELPPKDGGSKVPGEKNPSFTVVKNAVKVTAADGEKERPDGMFLEAGDKIFYSFTLTNTGNVTLKKARLQDEKLGLDTTVEINLAPGAEYTYDGAAPYVVTQADMDAGKVHNVVNVTIPDTDIPPEDGDHDVPGEKTPDFSVQKNAVKVTEADGETLREDGKFHAAGDKIYYSFTVKNSGNVTITKVKFVDELLGVDVTLEQTILPGESYTYEVPEPYTVTQSDVDAGEVLNTVTVTPTTPDGELPPKDGGHKVPGSKEPKFTVVKNASKVTDENGKERPDVTFRAAGDKIYYSFTLTNTGNVTLKNARLQDEKLGLDVTVEINLAPGAAYTYEASEPYVVTQADMDAGTVYNVVNVTIPDTDIPPEDGDDNVPGSKEPKFTVEKNAVRVTDENGKERPDVMFRETGDKIYYSFTLMNTGNVTLKNARLQDEKLGLDVTLEINLAPGAAYTYEASEPYVVTQADMDAGKVHNVVNVTIPDTDIPPEDGDHDVPGEKTPDFSVQKNALKVTESDGKTVREDGKFHAAGDKIYYSFTVRNEGNVTISSVKFDDPLLNVLITVDEKILPGASYTYEVPEPYTVTQSDVEAGEVLNTVTVTPTTPDGELPPKDGGSKVPGEKNPGFTVRKNAFKVTDENGKERPDAMFREAGDKIYYSFTLTNTGNVTLNKARLQDEKLGLDVTLEINLAPGASYTHEAAEPYVVTQADMDAGKVHNVVNVTIPDTDIPPEDGGNDVPGSKEPKYTVEKNAVRVTDENGKERPDAMFREAGDKIYYSFTLTNTGNVTLNKARLQDEKLGLDVTLEINLAPGASYTYEAAEPYVVTQADMDAGKVHNVVNVTIPDTDIPPEDGGNDVPGSKEPKYTVEKNAVRVTDENGKERLDAMFREAGDKIYYSFTLTNTGNVTLNKARLQDEKLGLDVTLEINLAPGASYTYEAPEPYVVTQADMDAGKVHNVVNVTIPDTDIPPEDGGNDVPGSKEPKYTVEKNAVRVTDENGKERPDAMFREAGDKIYYSFTLTNTGNVTLKNARFQDEKLGLDVTLEINLAPGASYTYEASEPYVVTQADMDAGKVHNVVNVTIPDTDIPPEDGGNDVPGSKEPKYTVEKHTVKVTAADGKTVREDGKFCAEGDKIFYSFTVKNTGNITLTKARFVDTRLELDVTVSETIRPGESYTYEAAEPYTVKAEDIEAGEVLNIVKVTPTTPDGDLPPDEGSNKTPGVKKTDFEVRKTTLKVTDASGKPYADKQFREAGDKIYYSFTIENTGAEPISKVRFVDKLLAADVTLEQTILPGKSYTYDYPEAYTVTADDAAKGQVLNTVTVTPTTPDGELPPKDGGNKTPKRPESKLSVVKRLDRITDANGKVYEDQKFRAAGDKLYYSFEIKNTGETTLTKLNIADAKLDINVTLDLVIKPNESYTYRAEKPYVITEADVKLGKVLNTVTVKGTGPKGSTPEVPGRHETPSRPPQPEVPETGEKSERFLAAALLLLTAGAAFGLRNRYKRKNRDFAQPPMSKL